MAVGATFSLVGGINDIGMEERRRVYHVTGDESPTASLAIKGRTAGGPPRSGPPHWSICWLLAFLLLFHANNHAWLLISSGFEPLLGALELSEIFAFQSAYHSNFSCSFSHFDAGMSVAIFIFCC